MMNDYVEEVLSRGGFSEADIESLRAQFHLTPTQRRYLLAEISQLMAQRMLRRMNSGDVTALMQQEAYESGAFDRLTSLLTLSDDNMEDKHEPVR